MLIFLLFCMSIEHLEITLFFYFRFPDKSVVPDELSIPYINIMFKLCLSSQGTTTYSYIIILYTSCNIKGICAHLPQKLHKYPEYQI